MHKKFCVKSHLVLSIIALAPVTAWTQGKPQASPSAVQVESISGALLQKRGSEWLPVKVKQAVPAKALLVSFPKSVLRSSNGAVELLMLSDIGKRGIYPILETAVVVGKSKGADLDLRFERGLIVLSNLKKQGAANIRVHLRDTTRMLTLQEPGTKVVIELYSRQAPGLPQFKDLMTKAPMANLVVFVVKGKAFIHADNVGLHLSAPPGPALLHWDSESKSPVVQRVEKMPEEIKSDDAKILEKINTCISCVMSGKVGPALEGLIKSDNKLDRMVAVTMLGAVDHLPPLIESLGDKNADVRDHAVVTLRHWIGREPGQVKTAYELMTNKKHLTRATALTALQLLFGFDAEQRKNPAIYQLLIGLLNHSKVQGRQLAYYNLSRLAPAGKDIAYDPTAPEAQRRAAIEQWHQLIPAGHLPPPPKKK